MGLGFGVWGLGFMWVSGLGGVVFWAFRILELCLGLSA